jgi:uncharacterized membrane protein (DUF2068 family)
VAAQARRDARLVGKPDRAAAPAALWLIGAFKLAKGLILVVVGLGTLHLVHRDLSETAVAITRRFHLNPANRYLDLALSRFLSLDARQLRQISAGTFCYAALLLTEGVGLLLRKRWAEYFTVIVTGSFIPLELYELTRRISTTRVIVLAINVAIVWYLVAVLRRSVSGERVKP